MAKKEEQAKKKVLTAADIFSVPVGIHEFDVPEWGGVIYAKEFTALQIQKNAEFVLDNKGNPDMSKAMKVPVRMCLQQAVDENGERIFDDKDLQKLLEMHGRVVNRFAEFVRKISGMEQAAEADSPLAIWLKENHPGVFEEYKESTSPVEAAKKSFFR